MFLTTSNIHLFYYLLIVSISAFDSLVSILIGIAISVVGLKICAIIAGIKKYKSIIKKKSMIK